MLGGSPRLRRRPATHPRRVRENPGRLERRGPTPELASGESPASRRRMLEPRCAPERPRSRGRLGKIRTSACDGLNPPGSGRSRDSRRNWTRRAPPTRLAFRERSAGAVHKKARLRKQIGSRSEPKWSDTSRKAGRWKRREEKRKAATITQPCVATTSFIAPLEIEASSP